MESSLVEVIQSMIQEACDAKGTGVAVSLDTRLSELGVDSLKLIEIIFKVETQFAVAANEELLAELETVGDIVQMFEKSIALET